MSQIARRRWLGFMALVLVAGTGSSLSRGASVISPEPDYWDTVSLPKNAGGTLWQQLSDTTIPGERVEEYVPFGETAADWSQIITVKTLTISRNPRAIVDGTVSLMRDICDHLSVVNVASKQQVGKSSDTFMPLPVYDESDIFTVCSHPDLPKMQAKLANSKVTLKPYEVTWYKIMKGSNANFIVQRAWHGNAPGPFNVLGSPTVLAEWKSWVMHVTLLRQRASYIKAQ
jgi:hypothetical protein